MLLEVNVASGVLEVVVTVVLALVCVMLLLLVVLVVVLVVLVVLEVEEELLVQLVVLLLVVLELVVVVLELRVELVLLVALVVVRVVMEELLVEEELVVWLAVLPANRIDLSQTLRLSTEASKPEILEALDLEIRLVGTDYIKHVHTKIYFTTFTLNNSDAPKSCICSTTFYFHFEILFNLPPMRPKILRK